MRRCVDGVPWRRSSWVRNMRRFAGEAKESYAVRGTLEQLSDSLTSEVIYIQQYPEACVQAWKILKKSRDAVADVLTGLLTDVCVAYYPLEARG